MSYFTEEELRLLGQKYLEDHPELEDRVRAERAKAEKENPTVPAPVNESAETEASDYQKQADEGIAIVYPVSWPSPTEDVPNPHSTLIFLGNVSEVDFTKDDLKAALKVFLWEPFDAALGEVKMFGENSDVPVVTLLGEQLFVNRQQLEEELNGRGIKDASEFDYSPHITVDPASMAAMPFHSVRLGKPQIWWGTERS